MRLWRFTEARRTIESAWQILSELASNLFSIRILKYTDLNACPKEQVPPLKSHSNRSLMAQFFFVKI